MRILTAAALAAFTLAAPAADAAPPAGDRFQITPAEGGFLRLDRDSGATSFCRQAVEGYSCAPVTESGGTAPESDVARIEKRLAAIEDRLKTLEGTAGSAKAPDAKDGPALQMPTDEQIDKAAGFVEKALKRLREMAETLQKEAETAPPDRQRL